MELVELLLLVAFWLVQLYKYNMDQLQTFVTVTLTV